MKLTLKKTDKLFDNICKYSATVLGSILGMLFLAYVIYIAICNVPETMKVIGGLASVILAICIIGVLCVRFIAARIIFKAIFASFCIALIVKLIYALSVYGTGIGGTP